MTRSFSFKKGWNQLTAKDQAQVRSQIMRALGIQSIPSFYPRLNGAIEPKVTEAEAIEKIFKKRGIKNIWGNE